MGLLSYLADFKNLENLKEEMHLNQADNDFKFYLYRNDDMNIVGVLGTQESKKFIIIRYLSLAPGFRDDKNKKKIMAELRQKFINKKITALPEYTYLLKLKKE